MADLAAYLALPYTRVLEMDEEGDIVATIRELPGCVAHGSSDTEALENLREIQTAWIEEALERGITIPLPDDPQEELPSGKWVQRVPRSLQGRLTALAKAEGTSLNQLVTALLSEAVAVKGSGGPAAPITLVHWDPGRWQKARWQWEAEGDRSTRYAEMLREIQSLASEPEDAHGHR